MDKLTQKLEELIEQNNRGEISGIGLVVKYANGTESLNRYHLSSEEMINSINIEQHAKTVLENLPGFTINL